MNDDTQDWYGPDSSTFGDRLAAAREAADMNQEELAKRLGVDVTTLQDWENDQSEPRANRLSMLSGMLSVSMRWLINGEGDGLPAPAPDDSILSETAQELMRELRDLRADMIARAEQLSRLERKLRIALEEDSNG